MWSGAGHNLYISSLYTDGGFLFDWLFMMYFLVTSVSAHDVTANLALIGYRATDIWKVTYDSVYMTVGVQLVW